MNTDVLLGQILSQMVAQLPVLLASVAGIIAVSVRRPAGFAWALAGFALSAVLCVAIPVGQSLTLNWATSSGLRASNLAALGLVWSVLRAASLGLLLTAVLAPRAEDAPR